MAFRAFKVVSTLPAGPLAKDSLYLVRVADGFDLYATNLDGTAFPLNAIKPKTFTDKAAYDAYTPLSNELVFYVGV